MEKKFQTEINFLRALAVLSVIFYHFGFSFANGGYLGVDAFFVISGYLISGLIIKQISEQSFSLRLFYIKRVKRLFPALFFVILICIPIASLLLPPPHLLEFSQSILTVLGLHSNIYFWQLGGYFELSPEYRPLLHTWSLGLEEQFYILFPIFCLICFKLIKTLFWPLIFLTFIFSLALAQYASLAHPSANFFLLPTRVWEFSAGILLRSGAVSRLLDTDWCSNIKRSYSGQIQMTAIIVFVTCVVSFDKNVSHPSLITLLPILSIMFFIIFSGKDTYLSFIINNRYFTLVGIASYSLYLWHQPILSFSKYFWKTKQLNEIETLYALILVFTFSYLTWRFIENPFRYYRKGIFKFLFVIMLLCLTFVSVAWRTNGLDFLYSKKELDMISFTDEYRLQSKKENDIFQKLCSFGTEKSVSKISETCIKHNSEFLIWGDSHARALTKGLVQYQKNNSSVTASSCPPILEHSFSKQPNCKDLNLLVLKSAKNNRPKNIIMHADWLAYYGVYGEFKRQKDYENVISNTISILIDKFPLSSIVLVGNVPQWDPTLPIRLVEDGDLSSNQHKTEVRRFSELAKVNSMLENLAELHASVSFFDPLEKYCEKAKCLSLLSKKDGGLIPFAYDYGHITKDAAILVFSDVVRFIRKRG